MKNRLFILLYLLLLLFIFWFEFHKKEYNMTRLSGYEYDKQNTLMLDKVIQEYLQPLDNDLVSNKAWGIVFKKIEKQPMVNDENKTKQVEVVLKEKTLCIQKRCFRLLGIFSENGRHHATFYDAKAREKLKKFSTGEIMKESIYIKKVSENRVMFSEMNSTREWKIKQFDVNGSKYKPKEF